MYVWFQILLYLVVSLAFYNTKVSNKHFNFNYQLLDTNSFDSSSDADVSDEILPFPKSFFLSKKTFEEIGVSESLSGVIKSLGLERPSKIQVIAFENVYNGSSCIVADQTGSGKTLSYLLPLAQRLAELRSAKAINPVSSRQPFIVIITPTSELARYLKLLFYFS